MRCSVGTVESKILAKIKEAGRGWCFTPEHFKDLGSSESVRKALSQLASNNKIKRLAFGLYEYPRQHKHLGELPPNIDRVIAAITERDKTSFQPSGAYAANLLGLSEQVPAKIVLLTNGRGKTFQIGKTEITFKRTTPKNMLAAGKITGLLIQACKFIGKENCNEKMMLKLKKQLSKDDINQLKADIDLPPVWIAQLIKQHILRE